jgi:hypothetical protein
VYPPEVVVSVTGAGPDVVPVDTFSLGSVVPSGSVLGSVGGELPGVSSVEDGGSLVLPEVTVPEGFEVTEAGADRSNTAVTTVSPFTVTVHARPDVRGQSRHRTKSEPAAGSATRRRVVPLGRYAWHDDLQTSAPPPDTLPAPSTSTMSRTSGVPPPPWVLGMTVTGGASAGAVAVVEVVASPGAGDWPGSGESIPTAVFDCDLHTP